MDFAGHMRIVAGFSTAAAEFLQVRVELVSLALETVLMVVLTHRVDLLGQVLDGSLVLDSFARDDEPMDLLGEGSEVGEEGQVLHACYCVFVGEELEARSLLLLYVSSSHLLHDLENPFVSKFALG